MQLPLPLPDLALLRPPNEVPRRRRIYVNRNLRFDRVHTVGFDMDYTLAIYRQASMDRLTLEVAARRLVEAGYPAGLERLRFRTDFAVRGLLIDRELGNVLKMDRYRYVKKAYHGLTELPRDERHQRYHARPVRAGSARYHWVDTLYGLPGVCLFAAAVEALDRLGETFDAGALWDDIHAAVDAAHKDQTIPSAILDDPGRYLAVDAELDATLRHLAAAGKKLFLLTNSSAEYTDRIMPFVLGLPPGGDWRSLFDIVVAAARKPTFFRATAEPLLGEDGAPAPSLRPGVIYQGGCLAQLEALGGFNGDGVLYVGDHIFGDMLKAKQEAAWRTLMIIQELDAELRTHDEARALLERIDHLEAVRDLLQQELRGRQGELRRLDKEIGRSRARGEPDRGLEAARVYQRRRAEQLRARTADLDEELNDLEACVDEAFHPFWGSLLKAGPEVSLFGDQVESYACLYTDRVSNLLHYSPVHYFRSPRDRMPHEIL